MKNSTINAALNLDHQLYMAVRSNKPDRIKELVNAGADVNAIDSMGNTLLIETIRDDQFEAAQSLIEMGADIKQPDIVHCDLPILHAIHADGLPFVRLLVGNGADVNETTPESPCRALYRAAAYNYPDILGYLLYQGAEINHQDEEHGHTALMAAITQGNTQVMKLLLEREPDMSLVDKKNETALQMAKIGKFDIGVQMIETHIKKTLSKNEHHLLIESSFSGETPNKELGSNNKVSANSRKRI